jgi:hypothetical protein
MVGTFAFWVGGVGRGWVGGWVGRWVGGGEVKNDWFIGWFFRRAESGSWVGDVSF